MKVRSILALAASLLVTIGCSSPSPAQEGAKGLFFEQMEKPTQKLNTGIQYWIELNRDGKFSKVTNKYTFRTGDKIRFHITSNIDGYAYILLSSGSRGEQSVLFPEPQEDNKIQRGKDYSLPRDGFLTFDEHPGIEKVSLLLSRMPTDATAHLNKTRDQDRTLVASAATGSKDLIPSKILIAYNQPPTVAATTTKPTIIAAGTGKTKVAPAASSKTTVAATEPAKSKPAAGSASGKPASAQSKRKRLPTQKIASAGVQTEKTNESSEPPAEEQAQDDEGVVTVVYNDPSGVLTLEVDLQHM